MAENISEIQCPIMKKAIDVGYCDEIQSIADGFFTPTDDEEHLSEDDYAI